MLEDTKVQEMARIKHDKLYSLFCKWVEGKNREFDYLQKQVKTRIDEKDFNDHFVQVLKKDNEELKDSVSCTQDTNHKL